MKGSLAAGTAIGSVYGRRVSHFYLTKQYLFAQMVAMLALTYFLSRWENEAPDPWNFLGGVIGPPVGIGAGMYIGAMLHKCIPPLLEVWREVKAYGRTLGGYALGYVMLTVLFAGCYAWLHRASPNALPGVIDSFDFYDYRYYSTAVMTTTTDANPATPLARFLVAAEVLVGLTWTLVVFAAVLTVGQKRLQQGVANNPVDR